MKSNTLFCLILAISWSSHTISSNVSSISELIVSNFLQARKNAINSEKKSLSNYFNEMSTDEAIFKIKWNPELHDIKMKINREKNGDSSIIVITTDIEGTPEDFEDKNILEAEKHLLKYILIDAYLSKLKESELENPITVSLDKNTKVILPPQFMIEVIKNSYTTEREKRCSYRKVMKLVTVFSEQEFDIFVKKYFPPGALQKNQNRSTELVLLSSFTVVAAFIGIKYYKKLSFF